MSAPVCHYLHTALARTRRVSPGNDTRPGYTTAVGGGRTTHALTEVVEPRRSRFRAYPGRRARTMLKLHSCCCSCCPIPLLPRPDQPSCCYTVLFSYPAAAPSCSINPAQPSCCYPVLSSHPAAASSCQHPGSCHYCRHPPCPAAAPAAAPVAPAAAPHAVPSVADY